MKSNLKGVILAILSVLTFDKILLAQPDIEKLSETILRKDSLFWKSYNNCDLQQFRQFFTDDMEFYHDKGGITVGLEKLAESMKTNLCTNPNFRLRREVIPGTVTVYPLQQSGVIYGAIISGEHVFYVLEPGKQERLDGQARFTHVWLLKDSAWKMARVLSYDHGPAKDRNKKKEIALSNKILDQYVGKYEGPQSGTLEVKRSGELLILIDSRNTSVALYPEADNRFFVKERDLSFEFLKNEKNKASKLLVRENGQLVEEARYKQ